MGGDLCGGGEMSWGRRLPKELSGALFRGRQFTGLLAMEAIYLIGTFPAIESPGWDLLLSVLRPAGRAFHYLQSTATQLRRRFRFLRKATKGFALWNPTIFREKLSKAFILLVRGSTKERPFRWDVSITQEHSFRRNASPTSAPAGPGRPVPPAGIPPPADRRKYFPAHAVPVLRPPLPPCRAARWSRAPLPFGSPSFSAPFS